MFSSSFARVLAISVLALAGLLIVERVSRVFLEGEALKILTFFAVAAVLVSVLVFGVMQPRRLNAPSSRIQGDTRSSRGPQSSTSKREWFIVAITAALVAGFLSLMDQVEEATHGASFQSNVPVLIATVSAAVATVAILALGSMRDNSGSWRRSKILALLLLLAVGTVGVLVAPELISDTNALSAKTQDPWTSIVVLLMSTLSAGGLYALMRK